MELVYIVPGVLFAVAVDGNAVPDLILDDEHTQFFQLFAQLFDIETDNSVIQLHIGLVIEHSQRTIDVDFQCRGDTLRLPLFLLPQAVVQITERWHIFRLRVVQILLVDQRQAAVYNRLFFWLHAIPCAHDKFAQGKNKVRFHAQWVIIVRVVEVNVHRVDVVLTGGRNMDNLTAQRFHQRIILAFRVCNDNIVRCGKEYVRDFTLCTERLTASRCAEDQTVRVFQLLPVCHNHVVGHCVQTVIEGIALHKKLLRGEGNEDGCGSGGQCALDGNEIICQRQAAHKALFLQIIQTVQSAVELLRDTSSLKHSTIQFLLGLGCIKEQHRNKEHTLIAALQIIQNLLGLATISCKVARNNFHIITRPHSFLLFLDFHTVQVGNFALDQFDGFQLVYRLHMNTDHQIFVHIQELCQNFIRQFRGKDVQIGCSTIGIAHHKVLAAFEQETGRGNEVFGRHAALQDAVIAEIELLLFLLMKGFVHDLKPFHAVQRVGFHAQHLEIVENIGFNTLQPGLCFPDAFCFNAERDVLRPNQTVVTLGKLLFQHLRIFHADIVELVVLRLDLDDLVVLAHIALVVDERKLKVDAGIEIVEEIAPAFKDGVFVLILGQLVVDVVESDGFGIQMFLHPADTVAPHFQIRNGTLHGQPLFLLILFGFPKELLEEATRLRFLLRFTFYQECLLSSGSVLRFPVPAHTGFRPHSGVPQGV